MTLLHIQIDFLCQGRLNVFEILAYGYNCGDTWSYVDDKIIKLNDRTSQGQVVKMLFRATHGAITTLNYEKATVEMSTRPQAMQGTLTFANGSTLTVSPLRISNQDRHLIWIECGMCKMLETEYYS